MKNIELKKEWIYLGIYPSTYAGHTSTPKTDEAYM